MATAGERVAAAEVLAKAKARTARVALVLDGELLAEHELLSGQLKAHAKDSPEAAAIAARILNIEDAMGESEVEFVFRGLGRGRWRALLAAFPPQPEDEKGGVDFDSQEFPFAAMAACLVEPALTVDDLKALHEEALSEMAFNQLWATCLQANVGSSSSRPESQVARGIAGSERPKSQLQSVSA